MIEKGYIDLRSDTVTQPTAEMRRTMAKAEVGDDVFGEDPTVNSLQETIAGLLGKEAALFVPSGVMANQLAIKVHTQPGDEIIVGRDSHIFNYETGAPSLLSQVQIHTIKGTRGVLSMEDLEAAVRPSTYYMPRTSLICLENTHNMAGGTVYPIEAIKETSRFARDHQISMHLDGARLWNAWVATGVQPREYGAYFDSVSVCFSKGLGAPVGSALIGSAGLIEQARKYRKIFGGGMRQVGIIAAGALYAMEHHVERLREDHVKARLLAKGISTIKKLSIDLQSVQTNILIIDVSKSGQTPNEALALLQDKRVLLTNAGTNSIRAVTHMDVSQEQINEVLKIFQETFV